MVDVRAFSHRDWASSRSERFSMPSSYSLEETRMFSLAASSVFKEAVAVKFTVVFKFPRCGNFIYYLATLSWFIAS